MTKQEESLINIVDLLDSILKDDKYTPNGKLTQVKWVLEKLGVKSD